MSLTGNQYITATNPDDSSGFTQYSNTSGSMSVGMAGEAANKLLIYDRKEGNVAATYEGGASGGWEFWANNQLGMSIDKDGRVDITGSLYVNGTPKISTVDLIKAFSKLRDAVKDEETVESLKESITNCIGGLIEEWESMQSPATQEIEQ